MTTRVDWTKLTQYVGKSEANMDALAGVPKTFEDAQENVRAKLKAFGDATSALHEALDIVDMLAPAGNFLAAHDLSFVEKYPFHYSFEDISCAIGAWVERHVCKYGKDHNWEKVRAEFLIDENSKGDLKEGITINHFACIVCGEEKDEEAEKQS